MIYRIRRIAALILIAGLVGLAFHLATVGGRQNYAAKREEVQQLQDLRLRLVSQLAKLSDDNAAVSLPADMLWQGANRGDIESALQEKVLTLSKEDRLDLTSFGPAPGVTSAEMGTVGYQIEATATWENLLEFIQGLNDVTPPIGVSDLSLRSAPTGAAADEARLSIRAVVWGFAPDLEAAP